MPKSFCQSIGLFMACDEFYTLINEIHDVFGFGMNSNLFLHSVSLVGAAMPWYCRHLLSFLIIIKLVTSR